jgi:hypothetical protein
MLYIKFNYVKTGVITRNQLIWYGHVERMDPARLPKIMIHWKPQGRIKQGCPQKTWKDGIYIQP